MPTPSTLNMNWAPVDFTPTGGSLTTFSRVTGVSFKPNGKLLGFSGDANRYPVIKANNMNDPGMSIKLANIAQATIFNIGTTGLLHATLQDPVNGVTAGGGALKFTLANAVVGDIPIDGEHMQWAGASISFESFSTDGTTSPVTIAAL